MRIRKRQVPLPLSSLLPDLYFNRSPTATALGEGDGGSLQLPPLIQREVMKKEEDEKALDDNGDGDGYVDVKSSIDASDSKNAKSIGGSDSSTQVFKKNEKIVTLRKRRNFISFKEYEDGEEEEASGDGGGKKKAKKSGAIEEGSRCSRVNGRGWRCCQQTLVGYCLCEHHLGKGKVRSMNMSRGGRRGRGGGKKAVAVEVKKERVKLGEVKARSISSLLGQTSTSGSGIEIDISALADPFAAYDK